jgi:tetratricopeptide (TPR) repeat protein
MIMHRTVIFLSVVLLLAFCTQASAGPVEEIENANVRSYSYDQIMQGTPALLATSKVLYREAIDLIDKGEWESAREKLLLSADLSGAYPDPYFTLAKNELLRFDPECLPHMIEAFERVAQNFYVQSMLGANLALVITIAAIGALFITLLHLTIKYWSFIEHSIRERYSTRFSFPPASWIGIIFLIALVSMRLGIALYTAILIVTVWISLKTKEKVVLIAMIVFVSALSFFAPYSNTLAPVVDPGSATRRLSMINERGTDDELFRLISDVDDQAYGASRDYAVGTLLYRLEILDEARDFLLSSVSLDKGFAPAYINIGNVYFKQQDYEKAIAGYQSALAIDDRSPLAHYNLGQTYIEKMLFAESSESLRRANELGIEDYKATHPSTQFRDLTVYEEGFDVKTLWNLAYMEGRTRKGVFFSEILGPYLLFPFHYMWILLVASMIIAIVIGIKIPKAKRTFSCENCGRAACSACADEELGASLCPDCAKVVEGLSSVKVMEALLRHRRHKLQKGAAKRAKVKTLFFPGGAHIHHNKTFAGAFLVTACLVAIASLAWRGFYFKDPSALVESGSIWRLILPVAVICYSYLVSYLKKEPKDSRPFWILPQELRDIEKKERAQKTETVPKETLPWETADVL